MTAPKWAMERAKQVYWRCSGRSAYDCIGLLAEDIDAAHRKGWQAAIEAAKPVAREIARFCREAGRQRADSVALNHKLMGFADWAEAEIAIPYQPPEDRGDG